MNEEQEAQYESKHLPITSVMVGGINESLFRFKNSLGVKSSMIVQANMIDITLVRFPMPEEIAESNFQAYLYNIIWNPPVSSNLQSNYMLIGNDYDDMLQKIDDLFDIISEEKI